MYGFARIMVAIPRLVVADPRSNGQFIAEQWAAAESQQANLLVFPELSLTGYTCGDLFHQRQLLVQVERAMQDLVTASQNWRCVAVIGMPLQVHGRLFNAAVVLGQGQVWGCVPKCHLPNYREFYEKRWFASGLQVSTGPVDFYGQQVPFGPKLIFDLGDLCTFGIELCEDLWAPIPPSTDQTLAGAQVVLNLSASPEIVGKKDYRQRLVQGQSSRCLAAYAYAASGVGESTSDLVFSGDGLIVENGSILAHSQRFLEGSQLIGADIDIVKLQHLRASESSFNDFPTGAFTRVQIGHEHRFKDWQRTVDPHPFVPKEQTVLAERCEEIFMLQSVSLARRLQHIGAKNAVIGVSGGLDSTLALLVAHAAAKRVGSGCKVLPVTMPGFGTTERTLRNANDLCAALNLSLRVIDITRAAKEHLTDIGHDGQTTDITYENAQARERTQVLMDLANREGGIVVGTGDLSEMALGWSTYNGDHMSMYAVNCGVPKTLVRFLVSWVAEKASGKLAHTLNDIVQTPVSPELLPADNAGEIQQKTEQTIGPYEVHDFYLYQLLRCGGGPDRLLGLANHAFNGRYDSGGLEAWLKVFIRRFFTNQFKRNCVPDGPKVGTVSLSPRGDWRMPSDASYKAWLNEDGGS